MLNLSPRAFNEYGNIETISELVHHSEKDLSKLNGLGRVTPYVRLMIN
ncbi:DNA-directed RNA polymerase subunit alpha C-terminal domain-containing protein [Desulfosporosinus fructosivorans]